MLDKLGNFIKTNDCLLFDNGSKYIVKDNKEGQILKCITNDNIPTLKLSKITIGSILYSAKIITR